MSERKQVKNRLFCAFVLLFAIGWLSNTRGEISLVRSFLRVLAAG